MQYWKFYQMNKHKMRKNIIMPLRMGPIFGPNLRGVANLTTKGITGS